MKLCHYFLLAAFFLFFIKINAQTIPLVEFGSDWNYVSTGIEPAADANGNNWKDIGFDDSNWNSGSVPFESSTIPTYFRKTFNYTGTNCTQLNLTTRFEDGVLVYLNNELIYRGNISLSSGNLVVNAELSNYRERFAIILSENLVLGNNVLTVEIHPHENNVTNLYFDLELNQNNEEIFRHPYLQKATDSSITIKWITGTAMISSINYGTDMNVVQNVTDNTPKCKHEIEISGLQSNTKYFYEIINNNNVVIPAANDLYFKTYPKTGEEIALKAWILGDSGKDGVDQRNVRDAYYNYVGMDHTDMILFLGDNAYDFGYIHETQEALFKPYSEKLKNTTAWSTRGNHDNADVYFEMFNFPKSGECGGLASGSEAYYSYDYGNVHFIVLDSYNSSRAINGPMYNWCLADIQNTSAKWIIAYWHHPPYTMGSYNSDNGDVFTDMRENFLPILEDNGVDLVLSGHSHSYERSYLLNGHYGTSDTFDESLYTYGPTGNGSGNVNDPYIKDNCGGTVYVVSGSSSKATGNGLLDHSAMDYSVRDLGSCVLEIDGDELELKFIEPSSSTDGYVINDSFKITKEDDIDQINILPTSDFISCDGSIELTIPSSNNEPTYIINTSNGNSFGPYYTGNNIVSNLCIGSYDIVSTNNDGCENTETVYVNTDCYLVYESSIHGDITNQLQLNIKDDFCAEGDGSTDDTDAFLHAANFINLRKENVILEIPYGNYRIGRQEWVSKTIDIYNDITVAPDNQSPVATDVFKKNPIDEFILEECNNISIVGIDKPTIKMNDNLTIGFAYCLDNNFSACIINDEDVYDDNEDYPQYVYFENDGNHVAKTGSYWDFSFNMPNAFEFYNCQHISIDNINFDGNVPENSIDLNNTNQINVLGDININGSLEGRQGGGSGLYFIGTYGLNLTNLELNHFSLDGIYFRDFPHIHTDVYDYTNPNDANDFGHKTVRTDIIFDLNNLPTFMDSFVIDENRTINNISNVKCLYNARNGLSLAGGVNLAIVDSEFSYTAKGAIEAKPKSGIDIEPEVPKTIQFKKLDGTYARAIDANDKIIKVPTGFYNLEINNCEFYENKSFGLVADYYTPSGVCLESVDILNDDGEAVGKDCINTYYRSIPKTKNLNFNYSNIINSTGYTAWIKAEGIKFNYCDFYGRYVHVRGDELDDLATKFTGCHFSDCVTSEMTSNIMVDYNVAETLAITSANLWSYLIIDNSTKNVVFDNCRFDAYHSKIYLNGNGNPLEDSFEIKNSTFNLFSGHLASGAVADEGNFLNIIDGKIDNCIFNYADYNTSNTWESVASNNNSSFTNIDFVNENSSINQTNNIIQDMDCEFCPYQTLSLSPFENGNTEFTIIEHTTIDQTLTIEDGQTLNIQNTSIQFDSNAGIIVNQGGTLDIKNSLLTGLCCQGWQGITNNGGIVDKTNATINNIIPTDIIASNIISTSASLSWSPDSNVDSYDIAFRKLGDLIWNSVNSNYSFAILNNLQNCTIYEVMVRANCSSQLTSESSSIYTFQTAGCSVTCPSITGLFSQNVSNSSAFLAWDIVPNATYTLHYKAADNPFWYTYETSYAIAILFGLPPCTNFEWYIVVNCSDSESSSPSPISTFTTLGGNCKNIDNINVLNTSDGIDNNLLIYPNPTPNKCNISFRSLVQEKMKIEILDQSAKVLNTKIVDIVNGENIIALDLSDFSNGIYDINLSSLHINQSQKIIKN